MDWEYTNPAKSNKDEDLDRDDNNAKATTMTATAVQHGGVRHRTIAGEKWNLDNEGVQYSGQENWALSNSLDLLLYVGPDAYRLGTPAMHATHLPAPSKGVKGNVLYSGLTVVYRSGPAAVSEETFKWASTMDYLEPTTFEGVQGTAHTEFQAFLGWSEMAASLLSVDSVLAVIFEAHQTNTPCASCQKLIGLHVTTLKEKFEKPVVFRGSATQIYESAPGAVGRELHRLSLGMAALDQDGPADIDKIAGLHLTIG